MQHNVLSYTSIESCLDIVLQVYRMIFLMMLYMCVSSQQNEENKRKNKQAALKAQMDLEEARKTASEQQNNHSLREQEGEKHKFNMKKGNIRFSLYSDNIAR